MGAIAKPRLLRPAAVLVRGASQLQLGCDPERSVLIDLPPAVNAHAVAGLIEELDDPKARPVVAARLEEIGLAADDFNEIVQRAVATGGGASPPGGLRICVHGTGALRDELEAGLHAGGYRLGLSSARRARPWRRGPRRPTLVVLTDFTLHDPLIVGDLMRHRVPHLPVLLRDGVGVVGPLVLPGRSRCLRCADHHRATLDPQWPLMCAQLIHRTGVASEAMMRLTVGVALDQIEQISAGLARDAHSDDAGTRPDLVDRTVEIHARPLRMRHKSWPAHPHCSCGARWRGSW